MKISFVYLLRKIFFPCFLFCLLLLPFDVFATDSASQIKEITKQIKEEEAQLKKLRGEKKATAKRVAVAESKIENHRRILGVLSKDISSLSTRLKEIEAQISSAEKNISRIKKDIARSNIFVIDNLGYSYIKIISTAKNPEDTVKTLEILSKAGSALDNKIFELNAAVKELSALTDEHKAKLSSLESMKKEKQQMVEALKAEQKEYNRELTLLKNDEAGRVEYIEMLDFRRQELDRQISQSVSNYDLKDDSGSSSFAGSKGSLMWPVEGKVIEPYGERLVKEAGLKFFHKGLKIRPPKTSNIVSVADGTVVFADYMKGFGNLIIIEHGASYFTVYGNLTYLSVSAGMRVSRGYNLGIIDVDRNNNTSYLYFEIRKKERALNPAHWLVSGSRR